MNNNYIEINGDLILSLASTVSMRLNSDEPFEYFCDVTDSETIEKCAKPSKWTLLHEYIANILYDGLDYIIDKGFEKEAEEEIKAWLDSLKIPCDSVNRESTADDIDTHDEQIYACLLLDYLNEHAMTQICDATFSILFQDKDFLYSFNKKITSQIQQLKKSDYPNYLEGDGYLKRCTYIPVWLKDGVFHRDRGRCQSCGLNLDKVFSTDSKIHYDHIIPLRQGGTNDPTNYQLMCDHCNTSKNDRSSEYRNVIWPFWTE